MTALTLNLHLSTAARYSAFPVSFRNLAARNCKILAAEVSGTTRGLMMPMAPARISVIQDARLQQRLDSVSPATGPAKAPDANTPMAYPRGIGSQISARNPLMTARGEEAQKPPRNRVTQIVVMFCAAAMGIWKMTKPATPLKREILRPSASDIGPKRM